MEKNLLYINGIQNNNIGIHWETKNLSAIKEAKKLKEKGIENYYWFLTLCQEDLRHIDPLDPNLSYSTMLKIAVEIKINPIYFFREILRVPQSSGDSVMFEFNQANLAVLWLFFNDINLFLVIARQIGKTITLLSIVILMMYLLGFRYTIGLIMSTNDLRQENISRLKSMRDDLPQWLINTSIKDTDNKEGLYYHKLFNKVLTFVGQSDRRAADRKVRGMSVPLLAWDEFPYINNNEVMYKAAISAMSAASEQAKKNDMPTANMIFTTAGDLTTASGDFAYSIVKKCMPWYEGIYDCKDHDELIALVTKNSKNNMVYITKSYLQLGKDKAWLEERIRNGNLTREEVERDFLGKWSVGSGSSSILNPMLLSELSNYKKDACYVQNFNNILIYWFREKSEIESNEFRKNKSLILANDSSEDIGEDFTTFVVLDPEDLSLVASCKCNISNLFHISELAFDFIVNYEKLLYIPERNHVGASILDNVLAFCENANINPYLRIFNTKVDTAIHPEKRDFYHVGSIVGPDKKCFGFRTTTASRHILYSSIYKDVIPECKTKLYDERLILEIQSIKNKNGRIDHPDGKHDDLLMAWMIGQWFIKYAKNTYIYNIDANKFMIKHIDPNNTYSKTEIENQMELRKRRDGLKELIEITSSNSLKEIYKRELLLVESSINHEIKQAIQSQSSLDTETIENKKDKRLNLSNTLRRLLNK
jgi:hypothetical protein